MTLTVLSAIGLTCDVVGAVMLVIGLFRPPRVTRVNWAYTPEDAAKDSAFGIVGATLLTAGFVGQCLPDLGVIVNASTTWVRIAVGAAATSAVLYAYVAYGVAFIVLFKRRLRAARTDHPTMTPREHWSPSIPRFWAFDLTSEDKTVTTTVAL